MNANICAGFNFQRNLFYAGTLIMNNIQTVTVISLVSSSQHTVTIRILLFSSLGLQINVSLFSPWQELEEFHEALVLSIRMYCIYKGGP